MSGSVGSASGSSGGNSAVQAAQDSAQSQYTGTAIDNINKQSKFSQEEAEVSFANTVAKANPSS